MLDYNALKPTDLSRLVSSRIGNPDADVNTDILSGYDFTDSWLTSLATIDDVDTFTTTGLNGYIRKDNLGLVIGKTYKMVLDITATAGTQVKIQDFSGVSANYTGSGSNSGTYIFTAQETTGLLIFDNTAGSHTITINTLEITEWSGDILEGFNVTENRWTHNCITVYDDDYNYLSMVNTEYIKSASYVLKEGATYRVHYRLKLTSATMLSFKLMDFDLANTYHTWTWDLGAEQEGYFDFTATTVSGVGIGFEAANSGSVYLYELVIEEITGLVYATNFIPSP